MIKKDTTPKQTKKLTQAEIDSIKNKLDKGMKDLPISIPENARKKVLEKIEEEAKDSAKKRTRNKDVNFSFGGDSKLDKFVEYVEKNPKAKIDPALDSLGYDKTFTNRFLFTRAKAIYSFAKNEDTREEKLNQLLSYGSIALFILLPIFTVFLKLFYIRRKYTYVDHLIFVFHTQTVFFMLLSIYFLLLICTIKPGVWVFFLLFLIYLFLALKKFYRQGYFKTFVIFILLNVTYVFVASFGAGILISIALMLL